MRSAVRAVAQDASDRGSAKRLAAPRGAGQQDAAAPRRAPAGENVSPPRRQDGEKHLEGGVGRGPQPLADGLWGGGGHGRAPLLGLAQAAALPLLRPLCVVAAVLDDLDKKAQVRVLGNAPLAQGVAWERDVPSWDRVVDLERPAAPSLGARRDGHLGCPPDVIVEAQVLERPARDRSGPSHPLAGSDPQGAPGAGRRLGRGGAAVLRGSAPRAGARAGPRACHAHARRDVQLGAWDEPHRGRGGRQVGDGQHHLCAVHPERQLLRLAGHPRLAEHGGFEMASVELDDLPVVRVGRLDAHRGGRRDIVLAWRHAQALAVAQPECATE